MESNKNPRRFLEDKTFGNVVQKILETLCLSVPGLYNYNGLSVWYMCYTLLFLAVLNATYVWQMYLRIHTYFNFIPKTASVLESVSFTGLTFTNTLSVVVAIFLRRKSIVKLIKELKESEKLFQEKFGDMESKESVFSVIFIATHVCALLYFVLDSYLYKELRSLVAYYMTYFNVYMLCMSVLQICGYALDVKHKIQHVNTKMQELIGRGILLKADNNGANREAVENLKIFMKIFDRLCDVIEMINECFGVQIVLIVCNSVTFIIIGLNMCFKIVLRRALSLEKSITPLIFVQIWCALLFIVSITI